MLLQHGWLAQLTGATEGSASRAEANRIVYDELAQGDAELGAWVVSALEKRSTGGHGKKAKPPLHAAPLDAVSPGHTTGPAEILPNGH